MLAALGRGIVRRPGLIVIVWLVLTIAGFAAALGVFGWGEQQERQADAETDRAIRARDDATPPPRRPRAIPAAPANVTSVDPSRPVTNGAEIR